jgi:hypothetical protein
MMHQDEIEAELANSFSRIAPEVIGNDYLVIGTIEKKVWQKGLEGQKNSMEGILKHVADFKRIYDLDYRPAGWYPEE